MKNMLAWIASGVLLAALLAVIIFSPSTPLPAIEVIFKDTQYSFQLVRAMSYAASGGSDVGECLATAYKITEGDDEGWYREWLALAQRREKSGDEFLAKGQKLSAKYEYFRSSNYYRTAEFFLKSLPYQQKAMEAWKKSRELFLKGASLSDRPIIPVAIPFEKTTLPGYFCKVDETGAKRPLLIAQTGFDGTSEEIYFGVAKFAVERGYNCLIFEGPGQGGVIREQKIPFRHNWETVVTPVVDFVLARKEVDKDKIALIGISFGGYLAPRAVAFEKRIKACIANGGIYDFHLAVHLTPDLEQAIDNAEDAKSVDEWVYEDIKKDPSLRWAIGNGLFTFGAKTPSEWFRMTREYTMQNVADKITCNMLIVDSSEDKDMPGQAKPLFSAIKSPKEYMLFTREDGAQEHCQMGATVYSNSRILDWLEGVLK